MTKKKPAIASVLTIIMIVSVFIANMVTVSAASWKTGCFDYGYTAKGYTTVTLNNTKKDGYIKIFTYSINGKKTTADIHITLRDNRGRWLCEFDTKSGTKLRLGRDHKSYRIYIAKKYYSYNPKRFIDSTFKQSNQTINDGKCQMWAINTIVQLMENNREDTVVIFAGYPNEMKDFFAANPGLRSRVPFRIEFPDYFPDEMVQITKLEAQKRGFAVSAKAEEGVACICQKAVESTEKGNGRFCRNLVDSAILSFAERKYGNYCDTKDVINDFLLDNCDFETPKTLLISDSFLPIGFTA